MTSFDDAHKRAVSTARKWHNFKTESARRLAELEAEMVAADLEYRRAFVALRGGGDAPVG